MPEAVIVATARSPIGRAFKGSLTSIRPDDLAAADRHGRARQGAAARPARHRRPDAGLRAARRRAGLQHGPRGRASCSATTRARHDGHPVLLVVAADHPDGVPRDQGRRGRRLHLGRRRVRLPVRQRQQRRPAGHAEPGLRRRRQRTAARAAERRDGLARPARGRRGPRRLHRHGPDRREPRRSCKGVSREEQDEFGVRSQNLAEKALANGFWEREITPVTLPDGTVVSADDGPRPGTTMERVAGLKPVFRPDGTVTAGNCCPLNDGAAAVVDHERHQGGRARASPRWPGSSRPASPGCRRRSWASARSRRPGRRCAGPGMTIDDIDLVEINEAFAAQVIPSYRDLGIDIDGSTSTAARSRSATRSA